MKANKPKVPTLTQIVVRIQEHLKRIEGGPKLNPPHPRDGTHSFYCARTWQGGARLFIKYVSYQGSSSLTKPQALQYLAYLDGGGTEAHYLSKPEEPTNA